MQHEGQGFPPRRETRRTRIFSIHYINFPKQDAPGTLSHRSRMFLVTFFFSLQNTLVTLFSFSRSKMLQVHSKPSEEDRPIKNVFLMVFYVFLKITLY